MKTAMIICAAVLIAAAAIGVLRILNASGLTYVNAESYTAGNAEISGAVRRLDVHWTSGRVSVAYHSGSSILVSEQAKRDIPEDRRLRWWLDGDTLRVQYEKAGLRLSFPGLDKELTLTLPEDLVLDAVSVSASSADVDIPGLRTGTMDLSVTSGGILAAAEAELARISTTSGDVEVKMTGRTAELSVGTTSGSIRAEAEDIEKASFTCTSGSVTVKGERIGSCKAGTTSGSIELDIGSNDLTEAGSTSGNIRVRLKELRSLKIGTTSGSAAAELPETPGFTAHLNTVSGNVTYDLPLMRQGNGYLFGDGSGSVEIDTTSGDIRLLPYSEGRP